MATVTDDDIEIEQLGAMEDHLQDWAEDYYDLKREYYADIVTRVGELADEGSVLDVGSAPHHITYLLQERGYDVVALDIKPERLSEFIDATGIDVRKCDIEREPFPIDRQFDIVLLTEVFEHLRINPPAVLERIHGSLRPGGKLLLTTPNLYSLTTIYNFLIRGRGIGDPVRAWRKLDRLGHMGHVRLYSTEEMRQFLNNAGFAVRSTDYANWASPAGRNHSLFGPLARLAYRLRPSLRKFQILVAEKPPEA